MEHILKFTKKEQDQNQDAPLLNSLYDLVSSIHPLHFIFMTNSLSIIKESFSHSYYSALNKVTISVLRNR